jgi:hypothetical protein
MSPSSSDEKAKSSPARAQAACVSAARHEAPVWHIRADARVPYRLDQNAAVNVRADL